MDAKTGTQRFLELPYLNGTFNDEDIFEAVKIASTKRPSSAINAAQVSFLIRHIGENNLARGYGKGVRWLAMILRDYGEEEFTLTALKLIAKSEVDKVYQFALSKHEGQFRLGGERHFDHVLRVALANAFYHIQIGASLIEIVEAFQAGCLHDILEDTDATVDDLKSLISDNVIRAVVAVTHEDDDEPDNIYLAQVAAGGQLAILTKRYDRLDNIKSLVNAPADFRATKIAEIQKAVNDGLWDFDPEGKVLIVRELAKLEE